MKFILSSLIAAIIVAVASATECSPTGYVCYGHTNGETEYCSSWGHKNAVCHNGQCYSPPDCSSASLGIKAPSGAGASCKDTGYVCNSFDEGKSDYCERWAPNSVCHNEHCFSPRTCSQGGTAPNPDLAALRDSSLDSLTARLEADGEDQDSVPDKYSRLITEMKGDSNEDLAGDMTIDEMSNVYKAMGYNDVTVVGTRTMNAKFDDELIVGKKTVATGTMYSDSFTLQACYSSGKNMDLLGKYVFVSVWNKDRRMSTAFLNDDNDFCLQSDLQLTKYGKANVQLAKEHAALFTVSTQTYHALWVAFAKSTGEL